MAVYFESQIASCWLFFILHKY